MSSKNIVKSVGIFNGSIVMLSIFVNNTEMNIVYYKLCRDEQWFLWIVTTWTMIYVNNVESTTLPKFPSVSLDVWIINIYSSFGGPT